MIVRGSRAGVDWIPGYRLLILKPDDESNKNPLLPRRATLHVKGVTENHDLVDTRVPLFQLRMLLVVEGRPKPLNEGLARRAGLNECTNVAFSIRRSWL